MQARAVAEGGGLFEVVDAGGLPVVEACAFLRRLAAGGSSGYTQRSYALALAHFLGWLGDRDHPLRLVDRGVVESYIIEFAAGAKLGAVVVDRDRAGQPHPRTRKLAPEVRRSPSTVNHRLSVLGSFFAFLLDHGAHTTTGWWVGTVSPVPSRNALSGHISSGRDAPIRGRRAELRQRVPRRLPRQIDPPLARELIATAVSWRDKAMLTLLWRTGQRIGDWSEQHGRHGLLGMALPDLDVTQRTLVVRLKGARDEHRVPVAEDFWPLYARYLADERGQPQTTAAWVGLRSGTGRPLTYSTFESSLRYTGRKIGANVNAHMFRHTVAQALVETAGLAVAQAVLGHAHVSTTANTYAHVDAPAMATALRATAHLLDHAPNTATAGSPSGERYVFDYDPMTLAELDSAAAGGSDTTWPTPQEPW